MQVLVEHPVKGLEPRRPRQPRVVWIELADLIIRVLVRKELLEARVQQPAIGDRAPTNTHFLHAAAELAFLIALTLFLAVARKELLERIDLLRAAFCAAAAATRCATARRVARCCLGQRPLLLLLFAVAGEELLEGIDPLGA